MHARADGSIRHQTVSKFEHAATAICPEVGFANCSIGVDEAVIWGSSTHRHRATLPGPLVRLLDADSPDETSASKRGRSAARKCAGTQRITVLHPAARETGNVNSVVVQRI